MDSRGRKKDQKQSSCAIELQDVNIESWDGSELQILTELRQNTSTEYFGGSDTDMTDTRDISLCGHVEFGSREPECP